MLKLARLGAMEMKADGRVTDPKDLTLVRKMDAMDLQTELDQDFMWLLFGRGEDAVDEVSVNHPKPRKAASSGTYAAWWSGVKMKSGDITRRIRKGDARLESTLAAIIAIGAAGYGSGRRSGSRRRDRLVARPGRGGQPDRGTHQDPREAGSRGPDAGQGLEAFRTYLKDFSDLRTPPRSPWSSGSSTWSGRWRWGSPRRSRNR